MKNVLLDGRIRPAFADLKGFSEDVAPEKFFWLISGVFAVFYLVQVPLSTSNADVLVYALRSIASFPITEFAFLDQRYLLRGDSLPNYHLGHTLVLWLVYHIMPAKLAHSIWPAGLVSAISGGGIVGLTYLIWIELKFKKIQAEAIAVTAGIIPSIWYHNLIGEVYALQLLATLACLLFFLKGQLIPATLAFLFANLVTPISGLGFTLLLLGQGQKKWALRAFWVGSGALAIYLLIFKSVGIDISSAFSALGHSNSASSATWSTIKFFGYVVLNLNLLIFYLPMGCKQALSQYRKASIYLCAAILPQVLMILLNEDFLMELGSFQLLIFWALSMPIGIAISQAGFTMTKRTVLFGATAMVFLFVWVIPAQHTAFDYRDAGQRLKHLESSAPRIAGHWGPATATTLNRYGWHLERLSAHLIDLPYPNQNDLIRSGEDRLILAFSNKPSLRVWLNRVPLIGLNVQPYQQIDDSLRQSIKLLYENRSVKLFRWTNPIQDAAGGFFDSQAHAIHDDSGDNIHANH